MGRNQDSFINIIDGLPFVEVLVEYRGKLLVLDNVLLDTGSASTIFSSDKLEEIGLVLNPECGYKIIRGVGGTEFVFSSKIDSLSLGQMKVEHFEIEVGALDYGFVFNGILGMDFLLSCSACIDLKNKLITSTND